MHILAALLILIPIYLFATYPSWGSLGSGFLGDSRGDAAIYIWLTKHHVDSFFTFPSSGFDIGIYYPFGRALAYTDNYLLPGLLAILPLNLGVSLELTYNLTLIAAHIFGGLSTYLLCRHITKNHLASVYAGTCAMLCPYVLAHLAHAQLQFAGFIPLTLYLTIKYWEERTTGIAFCLGLALVSAFCSSVYYFLFCALSVGLLSVFYLSARIGTMRMLDLRNLLVGGFVWTVLLVCVAAPYLQVAKAFGERRLWEVSSLGATFNSYLSAPASNLVWGSTSGLSHFEAQFFLGISASAMALLGLVSLFTRFQVPVGSFPQTRLGQRQVTLALSLVAAIFCWLSFGIWISPEHSDPSPLSLFYYLWQYVPGFGAIRATGRFGVVTCLLLCVLAGVGMALGLAAFRSTLGKIIGHLLAFVIFGFTVYELRPAPFPIVPEPSKPGVWRALSEIKGEEALIALPFGYVPELGFKFAYRQTDVMRWSQNLHRPIMNGHSGVMPEFFHYLDPKLKNFPDEQSLAILESVAGLKYVVYSSSWVDRFNAADFESRLKVAEPRLTLKHQDEQGNYLLELASDRKAGHLRLMVPARNQVQTVEFEAEAAQVAEIIASIHRYKSRKRKNEQPKQFKLTVERNSKTFRIKFPRNPDPVNPQVLHFETNLTGNVTIKNLRVL